jgi:hypothetical protein
VKKLEETAQTYAGAGLNVVRPEIEIKKKEKRILKPKAIRKAEKKERKRLKMVERAIKRKEEKVAPKAQAAKKGVCFVCLFVCLFVCRKKKKD